MPRFSIIIPTYNRRHLVAVAIDSALAQDFAGDYEVIVGDDGSTDGTPEFIEETYGDRVQVYRQQNAGPGPARNLAVAHASGDYLALLDSDDALCPWTLSVYDQIIDAADSPSLIVGCAHDVEQLNELPTLDQGELDYETHEHLFGARMKAPLLATDRLAIRRNTFDRLGGFTSEVVNGEDVDFCARAGLEPGFVIIKSPVTFYRRYHDQQISRDPGPAYTGRMFLLDQEARGAYPGGDKHQRHRQEFLSYWARAASVAMLRDGHSDLAWKFYRRVFSWHVRLGRWKYLLGFPVKAAIATIKSR